MVRFSLLASCIFVATALGLDFTGKFVGIPEDALEVQNSRLKSPIVNGLNFQSRIDVMLTQLTPSQQSETKEFPVQKSFQFDVSGLHEGEYQLQINSYDFRLKNDRYRVVVNDDRISVFEDPLGQASYNLSTLQTVGPNTPLVVEVTDYKEYYETPQGKLTDMVMNSPFGFIFKNSLYTALFVAAIAAMAAPSLISYIAPDLAEQVNEIQRGDFKPTQPSEPVHLPPTPEKAKTSGRSKPHASGRRRQV